MYSQDCIISFVSRNITFLSVYLINDHFWLRVLLAGFILVSCCAALSLYGTTFQWLGRSGHCVPERHTSSTLHTALFVCVAL